LKASSAFCHTFERTSNRILFSSKTEMLNAT